MFGEVSQTTHSFGSPEPLQGGIVVSDYGSLRQELTLLAESNDQIQALWLIGSRSKEGIEADQAADLDAVVVSEKAAELLSSQRWLAALGKTWVDAADRALGVLPVRSLLFDQAVALDLVIVAPAELDQEPVATAMALLLSRGFEVVKDVPGLAASFETGVKVPSGQPTQEEFSALTAQFFVEAIRAVKRIRRGELWAAKQAVDGKMKALVVQVLQWQAVASGIDAYWGGRHIEQWASARAMADLASAFASFDAESVQQALFATLDAFRLVAIQTASRLGLEYAETADRRVTVWVRTWA